MAHITLLLVFVLYMYSLCLLVYSFVQFCAYHFGIGFLLVKIVLRGNTPSSSLHVFERVVRWALIVSFRSTFVFACPRHAGTGAAAQHSATVAQR